MFERFTESARRVLFFARYEVSLLGARQIGPEHLLLGLIREPKGLVARILAQAHVSPETIRREIEGNAKPLEPVFSTSVEIRFSGDAQRVLRTAADEADRLLHSYVGTEHLLLALLLVQGSTAATTLVRLGLRADSVRQTIVNLLRDRPSPAAAARVEIDHLVYGTTDLARGVAEIEARLGVVAVAGGPHPGRGTRNAIVSLGHDVYLEIIGPDPDQPAPARPRMFELDRLASPRLLTWAARGTDLARIRALAHRCDVPLGEVGAGSRDQPDGTLLSWQFTDPSTLVADGIVPFFIDWGASPHPARIVPGAASLAELRAEHPDPGSVERMLRSLGIDLAVTPGARPALIATIDAPRGRVELR